MHVTYVHFITKRNDDKKTTSVSNDRCAYLQLVENINDRNKAKTHVSFRLIEGEIE